MEQLLQKKKVGSQDFEKDLELSREKILDTYQLKNQVKLRIQRQQMESVRTQLKA